MFSMTPYYTTRSMKSRVNPTERYINPFSDDFFRSFFGEDAATSLKVDVEDKGDKYLMEADLPGVNRDDVHISVEDGVLTIAVERKEAKDEEDKQRNYIYHERRTSSMSRSFSLEGVNEENITAEYTDGVLHLTLPKKEARQEVGARRIEIQ